MQKIEVTGAPDLALLFLHQGCFCIAFLYTALIRMLVASPEAHYYILYVYHNKDHCIFTNKSHIHIIDLSITTIYILIAEESKMLKIFCQLAVVSLSYHSVNILLQHSPQSLGQLYSIISRIPKGKSKSIPNVFH